MAQVTFTIPDQHVQRVVRALCLGAGVEPTAANAKKAVLDHIRRTVAQVEEAEARDAMQVEPIDASGVVAP